MAAARANSSRRGGDDDDFAASSSDVPTWSLKNKTYDPNVLKELEMEVISEEVSAGKEPEPESQGPDSAAVTAETVEASAPGIKNGKENVDPAPTTSGGKKLKKLEEGNMLVVKMIPDKPHSKIRYMDRFSDELILMIFEWLPKSVLGSCARVCRRWRRLAYDDSLWLYVDMGGKRIEPGLLNHILGLGLNVIRFNSTEFASPALMPMPGPILHETVQSAKVQYLDLSYATISTSDLAALLNACRSLRKVSLESLPVSRQVFEALAHNAGLTTLNLCMCTGVDGGQGLDQVLTRCPIDELNVGWTDLSCPQGVQTVARNLPSSMRRLNFSGYRSTGYNDDIIRTILQRCPRLISLDFSDCINVTDRGFRAVVEALPFVEELFISRLLLLTPAVVLSELRKLRWLKNVQAYSVIGAENGISFRELEAALSGALINKTLYSTCARPTVGIRRSSIWGHRTR